MITHQTPEQIFQSATPEQKIIWNDLFLRYGENIAISQMYRIGAPGDLSLYLAGRMFFAYEIQIGKTSYAPGASAESFGIFDESNNVSMGFADNLGYWDVTAAAARFVLNSPVIHNIVFSRITNVQWLTFVGYRITYL